MNLDSNWRSCIVITNIVLLGLSVWIVFFSYRSCLSPSRSVSEIYFISFSLDITFFGCVGLLCLDC